MRLYSYYRSTSSWRVRIVLGWKRIEYEYCAVNIAPDVLEQNGAGFENVNPLRQVPVLEWVEDGVVRRLTQSVAIVEYLEESHPERPLMPRDAMRRARVREALEIVNSGIQPLQNSRTLSELRRLMDETAAQNWARNAIVRGLDSLERLRRARGGAYLVGDDVTLADVYLVPQLYNARRFGVDVTPFEGLLAVEERTSTLDAFVRARPEAQHDAPSSTPSQGGLQ
jgi:maleylpyruvate isomerase